jgi:hypothetical protein
MIALLPSQPGPVSPILEPAPLTFAASFASCLSFFSCALSASLSSLLMDWTLATLEGLTHLAPGFHSPLLPLVGWRNISPLRYPFHLRSWFGRGPNARRSRPQQIVNLIEHYLA